MLCFTRADFNNLLNFTDLRAHELTLHVDGRTIAARDLVSRFVSNTDVVTDWIDLNKLAAQTKDRTSLLIEVERVYPFHEALVRPCLELSIRHRHAYSPVLWIGREATLAHEGRTVGHAPVYGTVFEGAANGLRRLALTQLDGKPLVLDALALGALFVPAASLQQETERRARLSRSARGYRDGADTSVSLDDASFERALKSLWPAEAMGRLSTYIHLREGRADVHAFGLNISREGVKVAGRLGELYQETEIAPGIVASNAPNASLPRSPEVDRLALSGVVTYRDGDWATSAGWPVYVSYKDPAVIVRSNGAVRWLRLAHGDIESIERLEDQRNLALGARTAWELYGHLAPDRRILFAGLGLGVVQRAVALDSASVTCENNEGVIDAFRYIYPDVADRLAIHQGDFYDYVRDAPADATFAMAFLDFFDGEDRFLQEQVLQATLRITQMIVINRHIRDEADLRACDEKVAQISMPVERHLVEGKQLILAIRAIGHPDRTGAPAADWPAG